MARGHRNTSGKPAVSRSLTPTKTRNPTPTTRTSCCVSIRPPTSYEFLPDISLRRSLVSLTSCTPEIKVAMPTLAASLAPGVVGTYTHFEATEVFVTIGQDKQPRNIFTLIVAED